MTVEKKALLRCAGLKMLVVSLLCFLSALPFTVSPMVSQGFVSVLCYFQLVLTLPFWGLFFGGAYILLISTEEKTDLLGAKLMEIPVIVTNFIVLSFFICVVLSFMMGVGVER